MLVGIVAIALLTAVPVCRGHYRNLAQLRLRGAWLVAAALGIQIAIISVFDIQSDIVSRMLHTSTYLMIGICIVLNRNIRWIWVIGLGWASNFIVIVANRGVMPIVVSTSDPIDQSASAFENSAPSTNAVLSFLGDTIATPNNMPMANVFSIGDLLLVAGFALVVLTSSRAPVDFPDDK